MSEMQKDFREKGFVILDNLLSEDEVRDYKKKIREVAKFNDEYMDISFSLPDGVARLEQFWPLIFNEKMITSVREILGADAGFLRHTDLHFNINPMGRFNGDYRVSSGWHRDTRFRGYFSRVNGQPVWQEKDEPFRIARVAIYLTSVEENKTPIFIYPHSHDYRYSPGFIEKRLYKAHKFIMSFILRNKNVIGLPHVRSKPHFSLPMKPLAFKAKAGDAVAFDPRLMHGVPPRGGERYAFFIDFGLPNKHSYDYCNYFFKERKDMAYKPLDPRLVEKLRAANLYLEGCEDNEVPPLTGRFTPVFGDPGMGRLKRLKKYVVSKVTGREPALKD